AVPGLDPGLPHGRAGHHLLRPGPAEGVPRPPEGVVDVIPVDFVVAATLAVAAGAVPSEPVVYQAVTGTRNPLKYRTLVDLVQDWFSARPLYDDAGQPIVVPDWSFPGRGKVRRQLDRAVKGLAAAEKAAAHMPERGGKAEFAARIVESRTTVVRELDDVEP